MKLVSYFLIMILCNFGFAQSEKSAVKTFLVEVEKGGEVIAADDEVVVLEPGRFDMIFELSQPMGILVHASTNPQTIRLAKKNKPLKKLPGFRQTGMADVMANREKQVLLAEDAPNYWFYQSDTEHRFNKVQKSGNRIRCTRTIERVLDTDAQASIELTEFNKPLHFVFISYERGEDLMDIIEIQREYLTIRWE